MEKLLAPFKNALLGRIFCAEEEFVGLFPVEGGVVLARVRREEGSLYTRLAFERSDEAESPEAWASCAELAFLRLGWEAPLALCLPEESALVQMVDLPEEVTDWREAAYWEADGALAEGGLSRENIYWSAMRLPSGAAVVALERTRAAELVRAFAGHGLTLSALYCVTPAVLEATESGAGYAAGGRELRLEGARLPLEVVRPALFAALAALGEGAESWPESFLGAGQRRVDYGTLLSLGASLVLALSFLVLVFEGAGLWAAEREHAEARAFILELKDAQKEMRLASKIEEETAAREAALLTLAEGALPLKSTLVHLGTLRVEGVHFTGLSLGEGTLELAGTATGFEALTDLTEALAALPRLRVTDVGSKASESGEALDFTLRLEAK